LQAIKSFSRASVGGSGAIKAPGNYAPAFDAQRAAQSRGYDEILCLDAVTGQTIEEAGGSNFFAYYKSNNTLITPSLESETILAGVTRSSILELAAQECGCHVVEGRLTLDDLRTADEAFCCGTGAVVTPVSCVSIHDGREEEDVLTFGDGKVGSLTRQLYDMLTGLQTGCMPALEEKYKDWIYIVEP
jgi:branched-chain amino acid aminotransferase